jgi:hypothetical protein
MLKSYISKILHNLNSINILGNMQTRKQIINSKIMEIKMKKNISFIESVLEVCDEFDLDEIRISKLINENVKAQIQLEAEELNLIAKTEKLPI